MADPTAAAEGGGLERYPVLFNDDVVCWRMANKWFRDWRAGMGEIITNAVEACERAVSDGQIPADRALVSVLVKEGPEVIIEDNGTGIQYDLFRDVMTVLGQPGKKGGRKRRSGTGFFAYTTMSSTAMLDTRCADGTGFRSVCRDGRVFDVYEGSKRSSPGTTISLQLYNGETGADGKKMPRIAEEDVVDYVYEMSLVSGTKIRVDTESESRPPWLEEHHRDTGHGSVEKCARSTGSPDDTIAAIQGDGFEGAVNMLASGTARFSPRIFVHGVPVRHHAVHQNLVVNVTDSERYRLRSDKDSLLPDSEQKLIRDVKRAVAGQHPGVFGITTRDQLEKSGLRDEFLNLASTNWAEMFKSPAARMLWITDFTSNGERASLAGMIKSGETFAISKKRASKDVDAAHKAGIRVVLVSEGAHRPETAYKAAIEWGIPTVRQALASNPAVEKTVPGKAFGWAITWGGSYEFQEVDLRVFKGPLVMLEKGQVTRVKKAVREHGPGRERTHFTPWAAATPEDAVPYKEWINSVLATRVGTTRGEMTLREVAASGSIDVLEAGISDKLPEGCDRLLVTGGTDNLTAVLAAQETGSGSSYVRGEDVVREFYGCEGSIQSAHGNARYLEGLCDASRGVLLTWCENRKHAGRMAAALRKIEPTMPAGPRERFIHILGAVAPYLRKESGRRPHMVDELLDSCGIHKDDPDRELLHVHAGMVANVGDSVVVTRTGEYSFTCKGDCTNKVCDFGSLMFRGTYLSARKISVTRKGRRLQFECEIRRTNS